MFPKKGKKFPDLDKRPIEKAQYAAAISAALRMELDNSHRSIKTVMRWTGANERTVKNWFAGENGPRGEHLISLARHCGAVLSTFNQLMKENSAPPSTDLDQVRGLLCDAIEALDGWTQRAANVGNGSGGQSGETGK